MNGLPRVPRLDRRHRWPVALFVLGLAAAGLWLMLRVLPEATDPTWERLQETGILPICTDPSWPPFEFVDQQSDQIVGFDVDLAKRLASRLVPGAHAEIIPVGFDGLYDALLAGRCDAAISALPYEPMRTEDVAFSVAYFNAGLVLLVSEDTTDIRVLDDLVGRIVGVEWGFVPEGDARQRNLLRNLGLRRYDTAQDALRALHAGEVEAALVDRISALAYLRECGGLQFVGEPIADINYVIPVRPDSFLLLEEINRALLEMRSDGTLLSLQQRWF